MNGEYGVMGDLGMHALHLPLRAGWVAAERARDPVGRGARAARAGRRAGRRATRGTTPCSSARPRTRASRSRCGSRPSGSRPGETNTWIDRDRRHRGLDRVHDQAAEDAADGWTTSRAGRRPGGRSTSARSRPTRRSPARSSSSASPTRSCRCGQRSSTSSPTAATAWPVPLRDAGGDRGTHRLFTAALESQAASATVAL